MDKDTTLSFNDDILEFENQLCFPLYACAKEVIKLYKPFLDEIDLTYTQYITIMVLWQYKTIGVKQLGLYLYLVSGTLTPLLKRLEVKQLIISQRSITDERLVDISITKKGEALKEKAIEIPMKLGGCINLSASDAKQLYDLLYKVLAPFPQP